MGTCPSDWAALDACQAILDSLPPFKRIQEAENVNSEVVGQAGQAEGSHVGTGGRAALEAESWEVMKCEEHSRKQEGGR